MSELLDKIKSRRSIRKFKSDAVPEDILDKIIEAGTYAATGMNKQSPIIVAVTNRETRDKLSRVNCKIGGTRISTRFTARPPSLSYWRTKVAKTVFTTARL